MVFLNNTREADDAGDWDGYDDVAVQPCHSKKKMSRPSLLD